MKKIKVLHVTFDMTIGGAQQVIRQLVENMDGDKFTSEVACIDGRIGEIGKILIEQGVKIHLFERQSGFDFKLVKLINDLIKKNSYHIVHCHQYSPYVYGLLASLLTTAKVVFTEHGRFYPDYGTWKRKLINPVFSLFTSRIIAISEATKDALIEFENFSRLKISVIFNGITDMSQIEVDEIELKKQFGIPESVFLFGTISRLQPIKNQSMMIKAFKQVHDQNRNVHLVIVGDGEIRLGLEKQVSNLGLERQVTFAGFQKAPYLFHKIIDVFLLTSFSEGASMALLEAISFSTPCIATNVGGNPEILEDGVSGILIEIKEHEKLWKTMFGLINDSEARAKIGKASRRRYEDKFTVSKMALSYKVLYENLI